MAKKNRSTTTKPTDAALENLYHQARTAGPAIGPNEVKATQARCAREQGADAFSEMLVAGILAKDTAPWFDQVRDDRHAAEMAAAAVAHIEAWELRLQDRLEVAKAARWRAAIALCSRGDMRAMLAAAQQQLYAPSADVLA